MPLPSDIVAYIESAFPPPARAEVCSLVTTATLHDGSPADNRCQRAALVAAHGSVEKLKHFMALLKIDYRDVLVAGEYENENQELHRVRNLNEPFTTDRG